MPRALLAGTHCPAETTPATGANRNGGKNTAMKSTQTRQVWNWSPLRPSGDGLKGKPATTIEAATRDLEDGLGIPYAQLKIISPDECKVREKGVSFLGRDIPKAMTRLEHWVPGRFKTGASVEGVARLRVNFIPCPREGRVELARVSISSRG